MSLGSENGGVPAVMNVTPTGATGNGNCGGWGGGFGEMLIAMIMLFLFPMFFGGFGGGMWGGMGGWGNGGAVAAANGALTRADMCAEFNFNGLESAVRGVQQGLCDGFYAMQGSINNLGNMTMQGFSQAELSRSNQQAALMQQLCNLGYQQKDCCCETNRSIDNVRFTIAQEDCNTRNLMQTNTRDIIDSQNSGFRAILDKMCQQELAAKDDRIAAQAAQIQALQLSASQAQQNAAIGAMISASEATILRRTGAECPTAAYIVQPPTPVSFPTNCCGQVAFNGNWGNGCGNCGGC